MDPEEKKIALLKKKVQLPGPNIAKVIENHRAKKRLATSPEEQKINRVRNLDK